MPNIPIEDQVKFIRQFEEARPDLNELWAVDMALAGYTDCMVSQWLTEYVVVPLNLVELGRKQVPKGGIFWRTVVSKTGQIKIKSLYK